MINEDWFPSFGLRVYRLYFFEPRVADGDYSSSFIIHHSSSLIPPQSDGPFFRIKLSYEIGIWHRYFFSVQPIFCVSFVWNLLRPLRSRSAHR
jgi:hypothetical protein